MQKQLLLILHVCLFPLLTACTGLEGDSSTFSCTQVPGVNCQSTSQAYAASLEHSVSEVDERDETHETTRFPALSETNADAPSGPIRIPEVTAELIIAPWTDSKKMLHDISKIFIVVREARWKAQSYRADFQNKRVVAPLKMKHDSRIDAVAKESSGMERALEGAENIKRQVEKTTSFIDSGYEK